MNFKGTDILTAEYDISCMLWQKVVDLLNRLLYVYFVKLNRPMPM